MWMGTQEDGANLIYTSEHYWSLGGGHQLFWNVHLTRFGHNLVVCGGWERCWSRIYKWVSSIPGDSIWTLQWAECLCDVFMRIQTTYNFQRHLFNHCTLAIQCRAEHTLCCLQHQMKLYKSQTAFGVNLLVKNLLKIQSMPKKDLTCYRWVSRPTPQITIWSSSISIWSLFKINL
jgi:hypothetical protein